MMGRQEEIARLLVPPDRAPVVWVADDDPEMVEVIVDQLERRGICTVAFADGDAIAQELWRMLGHESALETPDAIVTDVMMPGSNGLDVVAMLRRGDWRIPAFVITGNPSEELREEAQRLGAREVFIKPFDLRTLASSVRAVV